MNRDEPQILLVEDRDDDVALLRRAFRRAAITNPMSVVSDGEQAIAYLSGEGEFADRTQHPLPALILLDLKLPLKSGFDVLAWRREQPGLRRIPIVVLTSSREGVDLARAYDLGANSYLVKPVEFDQLLEMVKTLNLYWISFNERPHVVGPG